MEQRRKQEGKPVKWPFVCRLCRQGILKLFCKVCPPVSADNAPMSEEEAHSLNMQMRYDEEAKGIVSNIDPETRKYFAALKKKMGIK